MTTWWVRIVAYENEVSPQKASLFVNQELTLKAFNDEVAHLRQEQGCVLRYELTRTHQSHDQVVGVFTWQSEENLSLYASLEKVTSLAMALGKFQKKQRKQLLKSVKECLDTEENVSRRLQHPTTPPPQTEKGVEERSKADEEPQVLLVSESTETPEKTVQGLNTSLSEEECELQRPSVKKEPPDPSQEPIITVEKEPQKRVQTPLIKVKKEKRIRKKRPPYFRLFLSNVQALFVTPVFKKAVKGLVLLMVLSLCIFGIYRYIVPVIADKWQSEPSFDDYLKKDDYRSLASAYEHEFWEWEEKQVESVAIETLEKVVSTYNEPTVQFDLSFLKQTYHQSITIYEDNTKQIRLNATRYSFLAYSYLQEGRLEEAAQFANKANSDVIYTQLSYAYLQTDNIKEAEKYSALSEDETLNKLLKDYRLLMTTLTEVKKQLQSKKMSPSIKKQLEESQLDIETELSKIREGK